MKKALIHIIFILFFSNITIGQPLDFTYFYAYGTDSINIYWDYSGENIDNLLGCDIRRYVDDPNQAIQINQELITSPDKNFTFSDTSISNDTIIYSYVAQYIFPDDTISLMSASILKHIDFLPISTTVIKLSALPKNNPNFVNIYWNWDLAASLSEEDTLNLEMNPFNLELYTEYIMFDFLTMDFPDNGSIFTSIFHLKELLLVGVTEDPNINSSIISNYPNPIKEKTIIEATIHKKDNYIISIYNQDGKKIKTLIDRELPTGTYQYMWNRTNDSGNKVPSGMYYCVINSNRIRETIKLVVL